VTGGEAHFAHLPTVNLGCDALYLKELAASDAEAVHVVIRDNAGFHLRDGDPRLPERVRIVALPPHSPERNRCEHAWDMIKDEVSNQCHRITHHAQQLRGLACVHRLAVALICQRFASDEIHRVVVLSLVPAKLVDAHDVRVFQVCRRLRLRLKALHLVRARQHATADHFHRHHAAQLHLLRLPHHAHAALVDFFEQFITARIPHARSFRPRRRFEFHGVKIGR